MPETKVVSANDLVEEWKHCPKAPDGGALGSTYNIVYDDVILFSVATEELVRSEAEVSAVRRAVFLLRTAKV